MMVDELVRAAAGGGVGVYAYDCRVTPETLEMDAPVAVRL